MWSQGEGTFDVSRISLFTLISGRHVEFGAGGHRLVHFASWPTEGLSQMDRGGRLEGILCYRVQATFASLDHVKAFSFG